MAVGGEQVFIASGIEWGIAVGRVPDTINVFERDDNGLWQVVQRITHPLAPPNTDPKFGWVFDSDGNHLVIQGEVGDPAVLHDFVYAKDEAGLWALATVFEPAAQPNTDAGIAVHDGLFFVGMTTGIDVVELSLGDVCTEDGACICIEGWQGALCDEAAP
jgi:hypothetical protein